MVAFNAIGSQRASYPVARPGRRDGV